VALEDRGQGIGLDRSRNNVASEANIVTHDGMETSVIEGTHRIDANGALLDNLDLGNPARQLVKYDRQQWEQTYVEKSTPLVT
jgi:hypothetical protein